MFKRLTERVIFALDDAEDGGGADAAAAAAADDAQLRRAGSQNLREHMIGILFAGDTALGPLQRQVLSHVFMEITHATGAMQVRITPLLNHF
eukprot:COSAG06_NODE_9572_length_1867_cov_2.289027_2_plen_92_part_00